MNDEIRQQARLIYEAVTLFKLYLMRHWALASGKNQGGVALTFPQMNSLTVIREHGHVTVKELAQALRVSAPSASAMVDRLFEHGFVSREQSRTDRREVVVRVTPEGREVVERMEEGVLHSLADMLEKMGPEYGQKWCEACRRLREVLMEEADAHEAQS